MSPIFLALSGLAFCCLVMFVLWLWQLRSRDAGIVDVGWAALLGLLALYYGFVGAEETLRGVIVGLMGSIWAFRLAWYLFFNRVYKAKEEDGRYRTMREYFGASAQPAFFAFFQIQATWAVLFSLPFLAVALTPGPLGIFDLIGVLIWAIAVGGETLADAQLAQWRANPKNKGRTCRAGLWRYSRHPNYFFEWVHWFAYLVIAIGTSLWWMTFLGPILMIVFLFYVTGIPHTERQALKSRGEDYRRYQQETSIFIPWFPKSGK